jgi:hypothetical protein
MNRGCVSVGEIQCDGCQRLIEQGQLYLLMEEKEDEKKRLCVECCLTKGYAAYVHEKGEKVLTFFPTSLDSDS